MRLEDEKIWVAGHTGMVGSALSHKLSDYNLVTSVRSELDLTCEHEVSDWFSSERPGVVFLAAAKVGGISANAEYPVDFLLDNLKIQNNVLKASCDYGVKKFVFLGSACTYPKNAKQPIKEASLYKGEPEMTNIWYATAKLAGIKLAQALKYQNKFDVIVGMPTNTYGPGDNFNENQNHVIPALIKRIFHAKNHNDDSVTIWGTGTPKREFLYVDDLADALIFLVKNYSSDEIINIGSGDEISIYQLARTIADVIGYDGEILVDTNKPDGVMRKLLDSSKLQKLGWRASTDLSHGISQTFKWVVSKDIL